MGARSSEQFTEARAPAGKVDRLHVGSWLEQLSAIDSKILDKVYSTSVNGPGPSNLRKRRAGLGARQDSFLDVLWKDSGV